jgi:hypothetical protein
VSGFLEIAVILYGEYANVLDAFKRLHRMEPLIFISIAFEQTLNVPLFTDYVHFTLSCYFTESSSGKHSSQDAIK